MGSAWEKHTTVPPGCRFRSILRVVTIRSRISAKLSPLGNRNWSGRCCTVCHSGSFIKSANWAPVQSPKSPSKRPRSEEHTSELQSRFDLVCRLLLEKKKLHE